MKNRLKELRLAKGLTQGQISKDIGIHQRAYSYYENGRRDIPNILLVKFADYYEVSIDYILYRIDSK